MNESCRTYEWGTSHVPTHGSSNTWPSHFVQVTRSCHTCKLFTTHMELSHFTRMNESCHTYEWVVSHIWMSHDTHMSHVTHMNESWHTYESCHTYEWVMAQLPTHMAHILQYAPVHQSRHTSRHTYEWGMSHAWISLVIYRNKLHHSYKWVMSRTNTHRFSST